ncbi:substrate-binding domain-containing protein [Geobacter pickeringii]|uniref:Phosphate ABC transporter substrate-binding protein n=1 Tax=Geobacter pickeringii TaxID=345632 RepID=A0A0B5BIN2_9BACT|nr:substrate-binding domain-containing protein [Geobacter pickeringii]AJE04330.1 phosphate ABC transporter substrate-binding protein [Geobacter pickeringii]
MKRIIAQISAFCIGAAATLAWGADEIKVGAGAAPVENVLKPVSAPFEKATGIRLSVIANGPKNALTDLDRGAVDAAAAGLSFPDWMALMKKEGAGVKDPSVYRSTVIGKDRIVVIVHKDNPVKELSKEQLKGIFTGKIDNWKGVGGPDSPIIVVWGKLVPGTNSMFTKAMLDGEAVLNDVLETTTAAEIKVNVASNPPAIGIGPAAIVDGSVRAPKTPEISRDIVLVTKGAPSTTVRRLLDFITGEGQKYVK